MVEIDRLIKSLYFAAAEQPWQDFRQHALTLVCTALNASSGAWHTRSSTILPGEFTDYPANSGLTREQLIRLDFQGGKRELALDPLPGDLQRDRKSQETGFAVRFSHRSVGDLVSTVLLRFPKGKAATPDEIKRAVGHMIEAGTLALNLYIQRDEWLHALGRPNRGAAAMIDDHGAIYVATQRFQETLTASLGEHDPHQMPCPPPREALEENGGFVYGDLHFRLSKHGSLYMVYVRKRLPLDGLSPREQQIARALANGKTFKSVARQYTIAISTVANHASRIYKKLGIFRREELVELLQRRDKDKDEPAPSA
jgi:DNA-binding CsgD family transcriptional regulator